jgi:repressor LexA
MNDDKLTIKEARILQVIHNYVERTTYPPSVREIARAVNSTDNTVRRHLEILKLKGYITYTPRNFRTVKIIKADSVR